MAATSASPHRPRKSNTSGSFPTSRAGSALLWALYRLATLDLAGIRRFPPEGVFPLADVTNPLLGPIGAAQIFGPQKGAGTAHIQFLERGLGKLASLLPSSPHAEGAGAAGGEACGLATWGPQHVNARLLLARR
ncbi:glycerate kinase [Arthrobacter nitrophenolicus]